MLNRIPHGVSLSLVICEVEEFVLFDRPAHACAVLFQFDGCLGTWKWISDAIGIAMCILVKVIARIKAFAATIRVCGTMNRIGARLHSDVNNSSRLPAVFRARVLLGL